MGENREGRAAALLPILIFLLIFLGSGFITGDFYSMPAIVAFLIALLAAFVQNRELGFAEKIKLAAQGVGDENIITMCLIFLAAGAFTGAVKAAGGVDSTVNLGLSILPSNVTVAGLFLIGCFISISMGTSVGTITALAPIAVGISQKTGFSMAVCAGAVVGGAMFGDNLSMISDTTIAAVKTQGCEMKDKFRENFKIVLPAALLTVVIFWVATRNGSFQMTEELPYHVAQVIPYLVVLVGALLLVTKLALAWLPNIEPVSLLVLVYTAVLGWKALAPVYVYVMMEILIWGLGFWNLCYTYVWLVLVVLAMLFRKMESPLGWAVLSGAFGLSFGALCALVYWVTGGWAFALSWWVSGIPFDLLHCAGNFAMALVLFRPCRQVLTRLMRT